MEDRENVPLHDSSQEAHMPRGGRWVLLTGLSIACVPLIAVVPDGWTLPLIAVSLALIAAAIAALALDSRARRAQHRQE